MLIKYFFCSAVSLTTILIYLENEIFKNNAFFAVYFIGHFVSLIFSLSLKKVFRKQIGNQFETSFFVTSSIFEIFFFFQIELRILKQNSNAEKIVCLNRLSFLLLRFLLVSKLLHYGKKRITMIFAVYGLNILSNFFFKENEMNFKNFLIICFGLLSFFLNVCLFEKMKKEEPLKKMAIKKLINEFSDSHFLIKKGKINELVLCKGNLLKKFSKMSDLKGRSIVLKDSFLNDLLLFDGKTLDSLKSTSPIHNATLNTNQNLDYAHFKLEDLINEYLLFDSEKKTIKLKVYLGLELSLDYFLYAKTIEIHDDKYILFYLSKHVISEKTKNYKAHLDYSQNSFSFYFEKLKDEIRIIRHDFEIIFCDIKLEIKPFELFQSFFSIFEILTARVESFIYLDMFQNHQILNFISKIKLSNLLEDTKNLIEPLARLKNIEFKIIIDESLYDLEIKTDFTKFKCILLNFLANALQSTLKNGSIELKLEVANDPPNHIKFSISDSIIGLDETQLNEFVSKLDQINAENQKDLFSFRLLKYLLDQLHDNNYFRITSEKNKGSCIEFYVETIKKDVSDHTLNKSLKFLSLSSPKVPKNFTKLHSENEKTFQDRENSLEAYLKSKSYQSRKINLNTTYSKIKTNQGSSTLISTNFHSNSSKFHSRKNFDSLNSSKLNNSPRIPIHKMSSPSIPEVQKLNAAPLSAKSCKCKQIMVIDPDNFSLVAIKTLLNSLKIKPEICFTANDAIEKLSSQSQCTDISCRGFKLIFVNFNMQLMDGINLVKDISKLILEHSINEIPLVGYTSIISKEEVKESLKTEIKELIFYPITMKKIYACLKKWTNLLNE